MKQVQRTSSPRPSWLHVSLGVAVVATVVVGLAAWRLEVSSADRAVAGRDASAWTGLDSKQATLRDAPASAEERAPAGSVADLSHLAEEGLAADREGDAGADGGAALEAAEGAAADRGAFPLTAEEVAFVPGEAPARARDTGLVFSAPADPAFDPALHKSDEAAPGTAEPAEKQSDRSFEPPEVAPDIHGAKREQVVFDEAPPVRRKHVDTGLVFTAPGTEPGAK